MDHSCTCIIEKLGLNPGDVLVVKTDDPSYITAKLAVMSLPAPVLVMRPGEEVAKISVAKLELLVEAAKKEKR